MSEAPRHRLLVVEDDPEIRYLLSVVLDDEDREIVAVATGTEAREAMARQHFDLILLDLILPDADGRSLLNTIRGRPETATTPVLVVSARTDPEVRQECYALGAAFYTEKPFDPDEIADEVRGRLERVAADAPRTRDPRTGLLNRAGLLEAFDGRSGPGALALLQLDSFYQITDRWGWEVGAEMIEMAGRLIAGVMGDRSIGRLGAGDFVVFAPDASAADLAALCEKVLEGIRGMSIEDPNGEMLRVTASIGVVDVNATAPLDDALDEAKGRLFRAHDSGRNQVVASDDQTTHERMRIVVAEDDEISATILLHRLEREGLELERFDNGRSALEGALADTPDLVILDVKMPGMDGFEVLEALRRSPAFDDVPIIMLTSMGSESDVVRAFQLGADDYVLKPFSPIELSARVWRLLRRGRSVPNA